MKKPPFGALKANNILGFLCVILGVSDFAHSMHYNYAVAISSEAYSQADWKM